jgi:hypothetical protein
MMKPKGVGYFQETKVLEVPMKGRANKSSKIMRKRSTPHRNRRF